MHACIHTYIHTLLSFHTPSCFVTHPLSHSTLSHTTVLTSRSFTTPFVFPSFPVPATTFEAHYWKKLTCGVIRSFNFSMFFPNAWQGFPFPSGGLAVEGVFARHCVCVRNHSQSNLQVLQKRSLLKVSNVA